MVIEPARQYRFCIQGLPVIQERARKGVHGNFYDPSAQAKKGLGMKMLIERNRIGLPHCLSGELAMEINFYGVVKGDLDNALKGTLDAGNGILWDDDKQFVAIEAHVIRKAKNPRTEFILKEF